MKKAIVFLVTLLLSFTLLAACENTPPKGEKEPIGGTPNGSQSTDGTQNSAGEKENSDMKNDILVVYFSCTQTTAKIADYILEKTGGTRYEIVAKVPYREEDLRYYNDCRADREQADPNARPEISGNVSDFDKYETVFIGYPIWHGKAPKIIYTFLESYDFSGKTIVPFCTSHSSGIGSSDTALHPLAQNASWKNGRRFAGNASKSTVTDWVESLR